MLSWSCLLLKPWLWLCICKRFPRFEPLGSPRLKIVFPLCTLTSVIFFRRIMSTDGRNLADRIMECGFRACYKLPNCAQSESQVFHRWKVIQSWLSSHFPSGKNCQLSCFGLKQDVRLILSFFFSHATSLPSSAIWCSCSGGRLQFRVRRWWAYQKDKTFTWEYGKSHSNLVLQHFLFPSIGIKHSITAYGVQE